MKKWHIRTLCILALGAVGLVALAYRPAFETDLAEMPPFCENPSIKLSRHDGNNDISFEYRWDLSKSPSGTLLSGDIQPDAFSLIQPAEWVIKVYTEKGQLKAAANNPIIHATNSTYSVKKDLNIKDKSFIIVDDVITTGSTINACASLLMSAGAKDVFPVSVSRTKKKRRIPKRNSPAKLWFKKKYGF